MRLPCACGHPVHAQNRVTIEDIRAAWEKRSKQIRSARFAWTSKRTDSAGYLTDFIYRIRTKEMKVIPPKDTVLEETSTLVLDGSNFRWEMNGYQWSQSNNTYELRPYISVQKGLTGQNLRPIVEAGKYPRGSVNVPARSLDARSPSLTTIMTCVRGMTDECRTYDLNDYFIANQRVRINSVDCVELQSSHARAEKEFLHLIPSQDFVCARVAYASSRQVDFSIDATYAKAPCGEWLPKEWSRILPWHGSCSLI